MRVSPKSALAAAVVGTAIPPLSQSTFGSGANEPAIPLAGE